MPEQHPEKIMQTDIRPEIPENGGTVIVVQRHGKYVTDTEDPNAGRLTDEASQICETQGFQYLSTILEQLPPDEREKVDLLLVASDTKFKNQFGQRSMETAAAITSGMLKALKEHNLSEDHLLNMSDKIKGGVGQPRPTPGLREPLIFSESPEFLKYMEDKYGMGTKDFWIAFENDEEKETRVAMEAEGPIDMANRLSHQIKLLGRFGRKYHNMTDDRGNKINIGRRLVIWADSHYDTISPYVKNYVTHQPQTDFLAVDYGGGITINIKPDGSANTNISGNTYNIDLNAEPIPS